MRWCRAGTESKRGHPTANLYEAPHLSEQATRLLHGHINEVFILQPQLLRRVVRCDALAVHHEANLGTLQAEATAISVHQLTQRRRLLDLELYLAPLLVLDLQLDV